MGAFVIRPTQESGVIRQFLEAGRDASGEDWFAHFMARLPENIAKDLKAHSKYLCDLKNEGKLLFAFVTEDFEDSIIVYEAGSLEEAKNLAEDDPFIKSGIFTDYKIKRLHHWI